MRIKRELLELCRQGYSVRREGGMPRSGLEGLFLDGSTLVATNGKSIIRADLAETQADGLTALLPEADAVKLLKYAKKESHVDITRQDDGLHAKGQGGPGSFACRLEEGATVAFPQDGIREFFGELSGGQSIQLDLRRLANLLQTLLKAVGETDRQGPRRDPIPATLSIGKSGKMEVVGVEVGVKGQVALTAVQVQIVEGVEP